MTTKVYVVRIEGWGWDEDVWYELGTYSTPELAAARLERLLQDWEKDGNDRENVNHSIDTVEVDKDTGV